jgi:excinuclease ABC subunit A
MKDHTVTDFVQVRGAREHNLLSADFPIGLFTSITGVFGSGKSSLVSQSLVELVAAELGHEPRDVHESTEEGVDLEATGPGITSGHIGGGMEFIERMVNVDQKPIGRTPGRIWRPTQACSITYAVCLRRRRGRNPGATMPVVSLLTCPKGRCETCEGEGFVSVELLFMPSVYAPCPTCHGARYNDDTLKVTYNGKNIAEVLGMTVGEARDFFANDPPVLRSLQLLQDIGLGYLRLGQPATELSGGEAQRIKLATELQRSQRVTPSTYWMSRPLGCTLPMLTS